MNRISRGPASKVFRNLLLAAIFLLGLWVGRDGAAAQGPRRPRRSQAPTVSRSIPEDKRPWAGMPWLVGLVLTAGALVVGFKNSKRTHLD